MPRYAHRLHEQTATGTRCLRRAEGVSACRRSGDSRLLRHRNEESRVSAQRSGGNSTGIGLGGILVIVGIVARHHLERLDRRDRCAGRPHRVRRVRPRQVVLSPGLLLDVDGTLVDTGLSAHPRLAARLQRERLRGRCVSNPSPHRDGRRPVRAGAAGRGGGARARRRPAQRVAGAVRAHDGRGAGVAGRRRADPPRLTTRAGASSSPAPRRRSTSSTTSSSSTRPGLRDRATTSDDVPGRSRRPTSSPSPSRWPGRRPRYSSATRRHDVQRSHPRGHRLRRPAHGRLRRGRAPRGRRPRRARDARAPRAAAGRPRAASPTSHA